MCVSPLTFSGHLTYSNFFPSLYFILIFHFPFLFLLLFVTLKKNILSILFSSSLSLFYHIYHSVLIVVSTFYYNIYYFCTWLDAYKRSERKNFISLSLSLSHFLIVSKLTNVACKFKFYIIIIYSKLSFLFNKKKIEKKTTLVV